MYNTGLLTVVTIMCITSPLIIHYIKEFVHLVILYPLSPLPTIFLWKPPICIICEFGICLLVGLFLAFTYK